MHDNIPPPLGSTLANALLHDNPALVIAYRAAVEAAGSNRMASTASAVRAVSAFKDSVNESKSLLRRFHRLGVPLLTVPQALAVVEAMKLGNALVTQGDKDFLPVQFLEALTDTSGFSTVAENVASALAGNEPPPDPVWTAAPTIDKAEELIASLGSAQTKLAKTLTAASKALIEEQDANALVEMLSASPVELIAQ